LLDATVLKLALYQHVLAKPRVEPVVDPSFNQVLVGSMSSFRTKAEQREDSQSADRSG
jgi:hypothetical protein